MRGIPETPPYYPGDPIASPSHEEIVSPEGELTFGDHCLYFLAQQFVTNALKSPAFPRALYTELETTVDVSPKDLREKLGKSLSHQIMRSVPHFSKQWEIHNLAPVYWPENERALILNQSLPNISLPRINTIRYAIRDKLSMLEPISEFFYTADPDEEPTSLTTLFKKAWDNLGTQIREGKYADPGRPSVSFWEDTPLPPRPNEIPRHLPLQHGEVEHMLLGYVRKYHIDDIGALANSSIIQLTKERSMKLALFQRNGSALCAALTKRGYGEDCALYRSIQELMRLEEWALTAKEEEPPINKTCLAEIQSMFRTLQPVARTMYAALFFDVRRQFRMDVWSELLEAMVMEYMHDSDRSREEQIILLLRYTSWLTTAQIKKRHEDLGYPISKTHILRTLDQCRLAVAEKLVERLSNK